MYVCICVCIRMCVYMYVRIYKCVNANLYIMYVSMYL